MAVRLTEEQKIERVEIIMCMRDEGNTRKEVAEYLGISLSSLKNIARNSGISFNIEMDKSCKGCGEQYKTSVKLSEYCSSKCFDRHYTNNKRIKKEKACPCCGNTFLTATYKKKYCSDVCRVEASKIRKSIRNEKIDEQKRIKAMSKLIVVLNKRISEARNCKVCNKRFNYIKNVNGWRYCSEDCSKQGIKELMKKYPRRKRISKDRRWTKNGKADYSINIKKLNERDNGICHICDEQVDFCDYFETPEGYFIAGNTYPSIDHVIPIAKGGLHQWNNVKIAHRICNSIKRDTLL